MYVVKSCELNQCCTMLDIKMNISTFISLDSVKTLLTYHKFSIYICFFIAKAYRLKRMS